MVQQSDSKMVFPGDRLSLEEEFLPENNVYVENGAVYSSVFGKQKIAEGRISVESAVRDINKMHRGMYVVGSVVGVLKSVLFLELGNFVVKNMEFIAGKDGKIVLSSRPPRGRMEHGHDQHRTEQKPAELGDIVLSKIIMDDPDIFTLSVRDDVCGVVYALCENCGNLMHLEKHGSGLYCSECKRVSHRKVSSLYGNAAAIEKLMLENAEIKHDAER